MVRSNIRSEHFRIWGYFLSVSPHIGTARQNPHFHVLHLNVSS